MIRYIHKFTIDRNGIRTTETFHTSNPNVPQVSKVLAKIHHRRNFEYLSVTSYTEQP